MQYFLIKILIQHFKTLHYDTKDTYTFNDTVYIDNLHYFHIISA